MVRSEGLLIDRKGAFVERLCVFVAVTSLEPLVERYKERNVRLYFRGDAAFASPDIYDY